mgnify:CR=1 FL=1
MTEKQFFDLESKIINIEDKLTTLQMKISKIYRILESNNLKEK